MIKKLLDVSVKKEVRIEQNDPGHIFRKNKIHENGKIEKRLSCVIATTNFNSVLKNKNKNKQTKLVFRNQI